MRSHSRIFDFLHRTPAAFSLVPAAALIAFTISCGGTSDAVKNPAPAISAFTTGTVAGSVFTPTAPGTTISIASGNSVTFRANFAVKDGSAVVMPGNIPVISNVPFTIPNITTTTTYTLTVTSGDGQKATATTAVNVLAVPAISAYSNEDATYYVGVQIPTNTPTVTGATPITYSVLPALPAGLNLNTTTGAITGTPQLISGQTTYTIKATNLVAPAGTTHDIKIAVAATPITFSASSTTITLGDSLILSWDATSVSNLFSAVTISATPTDGTLVGPFNLSGSKNVSPITTTTYTLSATPTAGGPAVIKAVDVTVGAAPVHFTSFLAAPTVVPMGDISNLSWTFTGIPTTLTLDSVNVLGNSGATVTPVRRQTFTLVGSNGMGSDSTTVKVAARGLDLLAGGIAGAGMRDGTGAAAQFNNLQGMSFDASGNLYIADYGNFLIRKVTPGGVVTTFAGQAGVKGLLDDADPKVATLNGPRAIDIDAFGNMIVSDGGSSATGKLRLIKPSGAVVTVTGADAWVKQPW
ncbi:MAG: putative Ig domain-containing protein, partial [Holophaga sp.]